MVPDPCAQKSAWYCGLHAALEDLYGETDHNLADKEMKTNPKVAFKTFLKAAESVFKSKGYTPEMLSEPEASGLIKETYHVFQNAIDTAIADNDVPEAMARKLDHDAFMFSGFKVHHELSEVGLSLRDKETGKVKAYETFANDVRKIHKDYNETYLRSEYQFAVTSSQMAAKWADVEQGKGRYDLQYRTAGDDRVREDHAAMNGITLPSDDPFWREYYPPNGWRCRCTAVEVNKGKYPVSDSKEAQRIGQRSTTQLDRFGNNKAAIFRFNPGLEEKVFPPKHPYLPKGCEGCTKGVRGLAYDKDSEKCRACLSIGKADKQMSEGDLREALKNIQTAKGKEIYQQLKAITEMRAFRELEGAKCVYYTGGETGGDFKNLEGAAKKAVEHGYNVYMLPNPQGIRTADFIFQKGNFYRMYDLKTVQGKNSVGNRLAESAGQTNRVLLNMATDYNARLLAREIKCYFESNKHAQEVLIFKGKREISVKRKKVLGSKDFVQQFRKEYGG